MKSSLHRCYTSSGAEIAQLVKSEKKVSAELFFTLFSFAIMVATLAAEKDGSARLIVYHIE